MTTFLAITALIFIVFTLWILCDTITEALSKGKSFAPNKLKTFK